MTRVLIVDDSADMRSLLQAEGFEVIAKVRENFPATRIIAISTAKTTIGTDCLALAQKAGPAAILRKPVQNARAVNPLLLSIAG